MKNSFEGQQSIRAIVLSSSLLTERIILYSSFLPALEGRAEIELWTTSKKDKDHDRAEAGPGALTAIEPFPEIKPFREFPYTHLRRLNDFAWDYRLRPPSRTGFVRKLRDNDARPDIRALKLPARLVAALRMEKPLEDWLEGVLLDYPRSPQSERRLRLASPDILLTTGTFRYEEPAVTAAAKKLGIPTLAFITSWDNPSTKNRMVFKHDGYLVWSEQMKSEMHHFFPETRGVPVYVIGAPQFDVFFQPRFEQARQAFCHRHNLDPRLPIILYALGSPNLFNESPSVLHLARAVACGDLGDVQLLIRPHPLHDRGLDLEALRSLGPRIVIQETGQTGLSVPNRAQNESQISDWVNTFRHASIIVNLSSTAAIDGAIFDKPVVNLDYDPDPDGSRQELVKEINHVWTHFKPIAESGGLWLVNDPAEMIEAVRTYLGDPALHHAARRAMALYVCGFLDGRCGQRMAEAMLDLINKTGKTRNTRNLQKTRKTSKL